MKVNVLESLLCKAFSLSVRFRSIATQGRSFYKPAAIRAFYLAVDLARANSLERATSNIIYCAKSIAIDLIFENTTDTALNRIQELVVELDFDFGSTINPDRTLAFAIDNDLTVGINSELVLQETTENSNSIHLTPFEEAQEKLDLLEEMSSDLSSYEDQYAELIDRIEELEEETKERMTEIKEINKEKLETNQDELDYLEQTVKEINEEVEVNHKEIDNCKEEIRGLEQAFSDLIGSIDISIENPTFKHEEVIDLVRSKIDSSIQGLVERIAELEQQELQNEFSLNSSLDTTLSNLLQELKKQLPDPDTFEDWWKNQGLIWSEQLRNGVCKLMIDSSNLGHNWQFSHHQMTLLKEYYDGNKLLVNCLSSDCYITRSVRDEIEITMLLPIAEIERRKSSEIT